MKKQEYMRNSINMLVAVVLAVGSLVSCVSISNDRPIPQGEQNTTEIIGKVNTAFHSFRLLHIRSVGAIKNTAYRQLLVTAQKQYGDNVDVRNISIRSGASPLMIVNVVIAGVITSLGVVLSLDSGGSGMALGAAAGAAVGFAFAGNSQKYTATGDVIRVDALPAGTTPSSLRAQNRATVNNVPVEAAVIRASRNLLIGLPDNSRIAVISVSSNNRDLSALVVDELEFNLVSAQRFTIVDRQTLNAIRSEQNFQMSGDVSDESAVSIGKLLGANIVITGSIIGTDTNQRLSLKALNVQTAQIITMVRETF
jgi:hypothetical protein